MRTYSRLALAALVATTAMAAFVGSASARNLSISNQNFTVSYSSLEFISIVTIRCGVTLEGSFHTRTIPKVIGSLIGYITRVSVRRPCTNGEGFAFNGVERLGTTTLTNTLPWHVRYEGFTGTLPNITAIRLGLSGARFRIGALGVLCIATTGGARGNAFGNATRNTTTGVVDPLTAEGTITFDPESSGLCGASGRFGSPAGDGRITLTGTTNRITVTLI
jgi:hypothetical protein